MTHHRTRISLTLALAACLGGTSVAAEGPPIRLFPPVDEPAPPEPEAVPPVREPAVRVEGLEAPTADAIGLPAPEGLEGDPWQGSDPGLVLGLVEDLPVQSTNSALRALARRVLLTPAPRPVEGEEGRLLAARIERLLAMGELEAARALVGRLPPAYGSETVERRAAETLLLAGETGVACERAEEAAHRFGAPFWSKLVAFCRLRAGEAAEARLAVELLREVAGNGDANDPTFFALFDALDLGGAGEAELPDIGEPSPLHIAMLREAGAPVPGGSLNRLTPGHLAAIARDPASAPARRIAAAERAAALGALPRDELVVVYSGVDLGDVRPEELSAVEIGRLAALPEDRARLYRALRAERSPALWAEAVQAVWRNTDEPQLRVLLAGVFGAPLVDTAPDPEGSVAAGGAALGLLAAGRPGAVRAWRTLAVGPGALAIPFALAEAAEPDPAELAGALQGLPAPEAMRLLALFHGLGTPVPEVSWRPTAASDGDAAPPAATWLGLRQASAAGRPGETVLLTLHLLGARPERAHPVALADGLEGLRRVDLDAEARALAVAVALVMAASGLRAEAGGDG